MLLDEPSAQILSSWRRPVQNKSTWSQSNGSSWRDEYNVSRLNRSSNAVQRANSGSKICESGVIQELFDVLEDLVEEQENFRQTIESKLDELDQLDTLICSMEKGFKQSAVSLQQLATQLSDLEANVGAIVMDQIEQQGYLDLSERWRLGERNDKSGQLIFLDRTGTLE